VEVRFRGRLDRHDPKLPRFVVLPASAAAALGLQHRVPFGRRSIKPWGDGRYFIDVPGDLCRKAAVDVGDTVDVSVTVVDDRPPADLVDALGRDTVAARAWARLTPSQQRRIVDDVVQAVRPTTRQRRIARWVGQLSRQ
jgi:Bacteriocin-protection, YdeI or OmpD-Associated